MSTGRSILAFRDRRGPACLWGARRVWGNPWKGSPIVMFSAGCARQGSLATPLITRSGLCSLSCAIRDGVFFDVKTDFGFGGRRWGREERPELLEYLAQ